jgi:hypothetical protein
MHEAESGHCGMEIRRAFRIASFVGVAMAAAPRTGLAAGNDIKAGNDVRKDTAAMAVVAEHRYRMLARVRPLFFWISKDDVGGTRVSWRGDDDGGFGVDLLIGSDPLRAPRKVNRWGYIAEQVRGSDARVIGVMKQSDEQSVKEAESQLDKDGRGGYVYRVIQGTASRQEARAGVTTVRVERDLTFRDIDPLLALVTTTRENGEHRSVAMPSGTRPGFLVALRDLVEQCAQTYRQMPPGPVKRTTIPYVYFGIFYELTMKSSKLLKTATIDGRTYTNVARSDFEIRNRSNGETTRFQLTYGTTGALAAVPVHAVYQPRRWFEVQLFLDDRTAF